MQRIVVVSMIKNEVDVVESFVRHSLGFADLMLIADHGSVDGTREILEKLSMEGLPVYSRSLQDVAQVQSEVLTGLMQEAFQDYRADFVLPLDADEFVVSDTGGGSCRSLLQRLDVRRVYGLAWRRYVLEEPEEQQERFLLSRACRRARQAEELEKVVIGRQANEDCAITIAQGSHLALIQGQEGTMALVTERIEGAHIAHYPWRCQEQAVSKAANGWLGNAAKYSENTSVANHWHRDFEHLKRGEMLAPVPLAGGGELIDAELAPAQMLRYTVPHAVNAFRNLLYTSERLADAYAEEHALRKMRRVLLLLPVLGDVEGFQISLQSVLAQDYPYKKLIVCHTDTAVMGAVQRILSSLPSGISVQVLKSEEGLGEADLQGDYVQWVFPGDVLVPSKVQQMLTTLEAQPELSFVMSNARQWKQPAELRLFEDLPVNGKGLLCTDGVQLWQYMLENGRLFSGGFSSALFRRQTMENCNWLEDEFADNQVLTMSMWGSVLEKAMVGVFCHPVVDTSDEKFPIEKVYWHEMEWFCLLDAYGIKDKVISTEVCHKALKQLCANAVYLENARVDVDDALYGQYMTMVKAAGSRIR